MRKLFTGVLLLVLAASPAWAYKVLYAEQWFRLVHKQLYFDPDMAMENIYYLEQALRADFANPLNALGRIKTPEEWERYRYLFYTQVCLLLIDNYLQLGRSFDKQVAYFYNYPWKASNLDSLDKAEKVYDFAKVYWTQARSWAGKIPGLKQVPLEDLQYWEDQAWRVNTGDLDYGAIIEKQLTRLKKVRADFQAMGPQTY